MRYRDGVAIAVLVLCSLAGTAKDKKKVLLPADVLQARTVLVLIEPGAGIDIQDPNANRMAQVDVEQALMKWGRFSPVTDASMADLIITVRKGHGSEVQPTIGGVPDNRPYTAQYPNSGGRTGAGPMNPASAADDPAAAQNQYPQGPHPQVELHDTQDVFVVYRGTRDVTDSRPLEAPAVWRYTKKDALHSPDVPAVEEFRKLVAESDKQQAGKP